MFAVVEVAHPELRDVRPHCGDCLDLAGEAATMARVTGSVGAKVEMAGHSVEVRRVLAVVEG